VSGCGGLGDPTDKAQQKAVIDHYVGRGKAVLILDSFTPRGFEKGVCDRAEDVNLVHLRAEDAYAAQKALAAIPDIDGKRVFLQGYSHGASASALAVDPMVAFKHGGAAFAGVVAYYPYCWNQMAVSVPTLVLIGVKDDWTPFGPSQSSTPTNSKLCEAKKSRPNFEVVIYPGVTHAFLDGQHPLPDQDPRKGQNRDEPAGAGLQHEANDQPHRRQTADAGDRGLTARACRRELSLSRNTRSGNHVFTRPRSFWRIAVRAGDDRYSGHCKR
jgi:dienelactone hydrolase